MILVRFLRKRFVCRFVVGGLILLNCAGWRGVKRTERLVAAGFSEKKNNYKYVETRRRVIDLRARLYYNNVEV